MSFISVHLRPTFHLLVYCCNVKYNRNSPYRGLPISSSSPHRLAAKTPFEVSSRCALPPRPHNCIFERSGHKSQNSDLPIKSQTLSYWLCPKADRFSQQQVRTSMPHRLPIAALEDLEQSASEYLQLTRPCSTERCRLNWGLHPGLQPRRNYPQYGILTRPDYPRDKWAHRRKHLGSASLSIDRGYSEVKDLRHAEGQEDRVDSVLKETQVLRSR